MRGTYVYIHGKQALLPSKVRPRQERLPCRAVQPGVNHLSSEIEAKPASPVMGVTRQVQLCAIALGADLGAAIVPDLPPLAGGLGVAGFARRRCCGHAMGLS